MTNWLEKRVYGTTETALNEKWAELIDVIETCQNYGNTEDLEALASALPDANDPKAVVAVVAFLDSFDPKELLKSLGTANTVLDRLRVWLFAPLSWLSAGVVTLAQAPLVWLGERLLPTWGYGIFAPITLADRIPQAGIFAALMSSFALYAFDQRLIAAGIKDLFFKFFGLFRADHWILYLPTAASLLIASLSTALSVVVVENQSNCGESEMPRDHIDKGTQLYLAALDSDFVAGTSDLMSIIDAAAINFSGNVSFWSFMIASLIQQGALTYAPKTSAGKAVGALRDERKKLGDKHTQLKAAYSIALAMAAKVDAEATAGATPVAV